MARLLPIGSMPLFIIPFPAFDPVLVRFGPVAIRWYALAYIVGILAGWLYARRLIRNEKYWGGPAPMTVVDFDDFVLWVTLGIILGGRLGYVLFYNPSYFAAYPAEIVQLWKGGMSRLSLSVARRCDLRGRTDRAVPRPHRQFHQWRAVGAPERRSLGRGIP